MSFVLTKLAIDLDLDLSPCEKSTLIVICHHAHDDGTGGYPSTATISRKTGFNERTVRIAIQRLVEAGLISTTQDAGAVRHFTVNVKMLEGGQEVTGGQFLTGGQKTTGEGGNFLPGEGGRKLPPNISINKSITDPSSTSSDEDVDPTSPDFVLSGDEQPVAKKNGIPPCPTQTLVDIFNERCGDAMRRVRVISPSRQQALTNRWRFIYHDCECSTPAEGIQAWTGFISRVAKSDFLMNRTERRFRGGLDFLVTQRGFLGVIEGKYDNAR